MAAISSLIAGVAAVAGIAQQAKASKDARAQAREAQRQAGMTAQGNALAQQAAIESRKAQTQVQETAQLASTQTEALNVTTSPDDPERNRKRNVRQQFAFDTGQAAGTSGGVRV